LRLQCNVGVLQLLGSLVRCFRTDYRCTLAEDHSRMIPWLILGSCPIDVTPSIWYSVSLCHLYTMSLLDVCRLQNETCLFCGEADGTDGVFGPRLFLLCSSCHFRCIHVVSIYIFAQLIECVCYPLPRSPPLQWEHDEQLRCRDVRKSELIRV
jgi:hypothetical protein